MGSIIKAVELFQKASTLDKVLTLVFLLLVLVIVKTLRAGG
ncbi:hypothetical protein ACX13C_26160 [Klebsiella oxytoca]